MCTHAWQCPPAWGTCEKEGGGAPGPLPGACPTWESAPRGAGLARSPPGHPRWPPLSLFRTQVAPCGPPGRGGCWGASRGGGHAKGALGLGQAPGWQGGVQGARGRAMQPGLHACNTAWELAGLHAPSSPSYPSSHTLRGLHGLVFRQPSRCKP